MTLLFRIFLKKTTWDELIPGWNLANTPTPFLGPKKVRTNLHAILLCIISYVFELTLVLRNKNNKNIAFVNDFYIKIIKKFYKLTFVKIMIWRPGPNTPRSMYTRYCVSLVPFLHANALCNISISYWENHGLKKNKHTFCSVSDIFIKDSIDLKQTTVYYNQHFTKVSWPGFSRTQIYFTLSVRKVILFS